MTATAATTIWIKVGAFAALFAVGMLFASRSGGSCPEFFICRAVANNADSARYWGVLGCWLLCALLWWCGCVYAARCQTEPVWWRRLPPMARLEGEGHRSAFITLSGLGLFTGLPAVSGIAMGAVLWSAGIFRRSDKALLPGTFWEKRLAALYNPCPWNRYCFNLGDPKGIEYKPILTDLAIVVAGCLALFFGFRLAWLLFRNTGHEPE